MQSLSPEETSRWCASLAPCGVRGELLSSLQAAIRQQQVDGKQFGELLRGNALQKLGVDGLNPRLSVAVRRAWNKDFENVHFIPHISTESHPKPLPQSQRAQSPASRTTNQPPPYAQRVRSAEKRAEAQAKGLVTAEAYSAANIALRLKERPAEDFCDRSFGDEVKPKAAAPTSFAPPEPIVKPPKSTRHTSTNQDEGSLDDIFAPKPAAPKSFSAAAEPQEAAAETKFETGREFSAPVSARRRPRSREPDSWGGVSLGDALAAVPKAATPQAAAQGALGNAGLPPPLPASQRRRAAANSGWEGVSLGDALGQKKPARSTFGQKEEETQFQSSYPRPVRPDNGWGGSSLDEALQTPAKTSTVMDTATATVSPNQREPANNQTTPSCPESRQSAPLTDRSNTVGRRGVPTPKAQDDPWAGVSLGDALGGPKQQHEAPVKAQPRPEYEKKGRQEGATTSSCQKSSAEIIVWLRTLPETHVPEQAREEIVGIVEQRELDGTTFTEFVQTVPPDVCGPKHAMKLKSAWKNVLAEAEARSICKQNLDAAAARPKAVALVC